MSADMLGGTGKVSGRTWIRIGEELWCGVLSVGWATTCVGD